MYSETVHWPSASSLACSRCRRQPRLAAIVLAWEAFPATPPARCQSTSAANVAAQGGIPAHPPPRIGPNLRAGGWERPIACAPQLGPRTLDVQATTPVPSTLAATCGCAKGRACRKRLLAALAALLLERAQLPKHISRLCCTRETAPPTRPKGRAKLEGGRVGLFQERPGSGHGALEPDGAPQKSTQRRMTPAKLECGSW